MDEDEDEDGICHAELAEIRVMNEVHEAAVEEAAVEEVEVDE